MNVAYIRRFVVKRLLVIVNVFLWLGLLNLHCEAQVRDAPLNHIKCPTKHQDSVFCFYPRTKKDSLRTVG